MVAEAKEARGIHRRLLFDVTDSLRRRFAASLDKSGECWLWTACQRNGYGGIKHNGKVLSAHVVAWVIEHGDIPDGMIVTHSCDQKLCCRVHDDHVRLGTPTSNVREMYARLETKHARGELSPHTKMTDEIVRFILAANLLNGAGRRRLSQMLGFSQTAIGHVIERETWKHIEVPTIAEAEAIVEAFSNPHRS